MEFADLTLPYQMQGKIQELSGKLESSDTETRERLMGQIDFLEKKLFDASVGLGAAQLKSEKNRFHDELAQGWWGAKAETDPDIAKFFEHLHQPELQREKKLEVLQALMPNRALQGLDPYGKDAPAALIKAILAEMQSKNVGLLEAARAIRREYAIKLADQLRGKFDFNALDDDIRTLSQNGLLPLNDEQDPGGIIFARAVQARRIESLEPDLSELSARERTSFLALVEAAKKTEADQYDGHNHLLKSIQFADISPREMRGPIDAFIVSERFKVGRMWWSTPEKVSNITAQTSKSPLRKLYGDQAIRRVYWGYTETGISLGKFRVAVNLSPDASGVMQERSLEVFARDDAGNWQPFFYTKRGRHWVPSKTFMGDGVTVACARCHAGTNGAFSPRPPKIMKDRENLLQAGYNEQFVDELMKY